jgi:hypothetical protein
VPCGEIREGLSRYQQPTTCANKPKRPCPSKPAPNSQEYARPSPHHHQKPGRNEGETAVPLKASAKQPGTDNTRPPPPKARHERRRNGRTLQNERQTARNRQRPSPHHQKPDTNEGETAVPFIGAQNRQARTKVKRPCPSKPAPNSREQTTAVSPTAKQPGRNEGETAVPLKTSAKQPGTDNGRLPTTKQPGRNEGETAVSFKTSAKQPGTGDTNANSGIFAGNVAD